MFAFFSKKYFKDENKVHFMNKCNHNHVLFTLNMCDFPITRTYLFFFYPYYSVATLIYRKHSCGLKEKAYNGREDYRSKGLYLDPFSWAEPGNFSGLIFDRIAQSDGPSSSCREAGLQTSET